jgi:hypothetical protein
MTPPMFLQGLKKAFYGMMNVLLTQVRLYG